MNKNEENKGEEESYLNGKLLLAMPSIGDARFHHAVIYVCANDENGAMGLVINQAAPGLEFEKILEQFDLKIESDKIKNSDVPIISGGPVEPARGFLLHSDDFEQADTVKMGAFGITGTTDALKDVAIGEGPKEFLFILGYAGWTSGQLEEELRNNAWLVCDADAELLFRTPVEKKWDAALARLGFDSGMLSGQMGSA